MDIKMAAAMFREMAFYEPLQCPPSSATLVATSLPLKELGYATFISKEIYLIIRCQSQIPSDFEI